ncbi:hypothetical protein [Enemella dayhoffiae]|uniref:hypothetical protein n=1 Tax=Enemella dayhoffiae TaxID=2016507 RepID=UPI00114012F9|nr:hypothetical protein [Enemella dayhoffiae]
MAESHDDPDRQDDGPKGPRKLLRLPSAYADGLSQAGYPSSVTGGGRPSFDRPDGGATRSRMTT